MPFAIRQLLARGYWAPAGDDGSDAGGGGGGADDKSPVDRGDDFKSPLDNAGKGDKLDPDDEADKGKDKGDETDKDKEKDDEETAEEKAEREAAEAEAARKARIRIPKARFDEAQNKARQREQALLAEIEKLKGGQQTTAAQTSIKSMRTSIDELQDKYEDLILDGKKEEARKVRKQIEDKRDELTDLQTSLKSDAARKSAVEELTFNAQLASLEAKYPALNPEHEEYDNDQTGEVANLLEALVLKGEKRADALSKAVKYVMGNPPAAKTADAEGKSDAAKTAAEQRAIEARKKAAEANKRQPGDAKNVGLDSDKAGGKGGGDVDVMRLSQDKFSKLDEEAKAKLRGDVV